MQYFDASSVNSFVNASGSDKEVGDPRKQSQAVIDYLNARGGLAGHKIVPVYVKNDLTSSDSYAQQQTNACARWTQDNHVAAAFWFSGTISTPTIQECARKNRFLLTHDGLYMSQAAEYSSNPYFVVPSQLSAERWAPAVVNGLAAQNFYSTGAKIGVLTFDDAASKAANRALEKSLAARGLKVADTYSFAAVQQTSDTGAFVSALQSAVLKFRGNGITHVMSILAGGGGIPTFMTQAESQQYFPKYGLSSIDAPLGLVTGSSDRIKTLTNTMAVGYAPSTDVAARQDPGQNPNAVKCRKILGDTLLSRTDELLAMTYCDFFLMLEAATKPLAVGTPLDADALVRQVSALQGSWRSATRLGTYVSPNRRDGVAAVRGLTYSAACDCFQYSASQTRL